MKKILIPFDSNFTNYEPIDYAISFFTRERCQFYILNTYNYEMDGLSAINILQENDDWWEKPKQESEMCLGKVMQKYINHRNKKHQFYAISERKNLIDGIKKTVSELGIDLIVLPISQTAKDIDNSYSRNTKNIIDSVRECPVMIIPASAHIHKNPKFVLTSNFESEIPKNELDKWFDFIEIANGQIMILSLSLKDERTVNQKINQDKVRFQLQLLSGYPIKVEYLENETELKEYVKQHPENIICMVDHKPNFWRICGISHSRITNLGPLPDTTIIALHR